MAADHVDFVLRQWDARRPDLDMSSMAVIGRLSRLMRLVNARLRHTFSRHGVDAASFDVLATLYRGGTPHCLTPADLMRSSMVTSGAITQRLDRLQARGLITREPSDSDGRGVRVALTRKGIAVIDQLLPRHVETENNILVALSPAERDQLADALRHLLLSLGDRPE